MSRARPPHRPGAVEPGLPEEEDVMKWCVICKHGERRPGTATVTFSEGGATVVFEKVPAEVCDNCGEEYVDEETAERLLEKVEEAARSGVRVTIRDYAAA